MAASRNNLPGLGQAPRYFGLAIRSEDLNGRCPWFAGVRQPAAHPKAPSQPGTSRRLDAGYCTIFGRTWQATLTLGWFAGIVGGMAKQADVVIRAFDGSLADAKELLAVERATFDESPYDAPQVRDMLTAGPQRAWLAVGGGRVVGFVIAFPTSGLRGLWWEIDLLAILSAWRGRRLATALIREAAAYGAGIVSQARAVVADDNQPSVRAFARAGFQISSGRFQLLIRRLEGAPQRQGPIAGVVIREASTFAEALPWLGNSGWFSVGAASASLGQPLGLRLLLAEEGGQPAGYAELVEVQTLLYRGVWIESLQAAHRLARQALVRAAVGRASSGGLSEVGVVVPLGKRRLQRALLSEGFRSLGGYYWLSAALPLADQAARPRLPTMDSILEDGRD